jgi:hypothetical protein
MDPSGKLLYKEQISYEPIFCRFGEFGQTEGTYVNRTLIKCLTPQIKDDSDISYEEVNLELAINGIDYRTSDEAIFTFVGPQAGKMLWVYLLLFLFILILLILLGIVIYSYWNKVAMQMQARSNVYSGDEPHVVDKRPRYLIPEMRPDLRRGLQDYGGEEEDRPNPII